LEVQRLVSRIVEMVFGTTAIGSTLGLLQMVVGVEFVNRWDPELQRSESQIEEIKIKNCNKMIGLRKLSFSIKENKVKRKTCELRIFFKEWNLPGWSRTAGTPV
jgi:hypothetical protein